MDVLIVGSGGREHAIAWAIAQSPQVSQVWVAPGNAGTALENKVENVAIDVLDITALLNFAKENKNLAKIGVGDILGTGVATFFWFYIALILKV